MQSEAAGEEAVAVRHVHEILRGDAARHEAAAAHPRPVLQVALRVAAHNSLARGAARSVQARDVFTRHGHEAQGITVAQILLGGKGQAADVIETPDIRGFDAEFVEALMIEGDIVVHPVRHVLQPLQLQGFKFFPGHTFHFDIVKHGQLLTCLIIHAYLGRYIGRSFLPFLRQSSRMPVPNTLIHI